jgi:hypothetical protein
VLYTCIIMFGLQLSTSGSNIILICWYIMEATRARYRSILRVGSSSNWHSFDVVNITTFIIFSFVLVRRLHCCNDETIYIYILSLRSNGLNSLKRISCPYMADRSHILEWYKMLPILNNPSNNFAQNNKIWHGKKSPGSKLACLLAGLASLKWIREVDLCYT